MLSWTGRPRSALGRDLPRPADRSTSRPGDWGLWNAKKRRMIPDILIRDVEETSMIAMIHIGPLLVVSAFSAFAVAAVLLCYSDREGKSHEKVHSARRLPVQ